MSFKKHSDLCLINSGIDYMLTWERTLQESVSMKTLLLCCYAFFGKHETQCEPAICSEELLGVTNQAGGTVKGKYFDNWYVICTSEQTHFPTKI